MNTRLTNGFPRYNSRYFTSVALGLPANIPLYPGCQKKNEDGGLKNQHQLIGPRIILSRNFRLPAGSERLSEKKLPG
jgi:hypothetical protein